MKLFIFGAGASKGSQSGGSSDHRSSPVVSELLDERYLSRIGSEIGISKGLLNDTLKRWRQSDQKQDFEEWLTAEWEKVESEISGQNVEAVRSRLGALTHYMFRLFQNVSGFPGQNYYEKLLMKLADGPSVGFISFNYDLLLDIELENHFGAQLTSLDGYRAARYAKPHGSINWLVPKRPNDPGIDSSARGDRHAIYAHASRNLFKGGPFDLDSQEGSLQIVDPRVLKVRQPEIIFEHGLPDGGHWQPLLMLPLRGKIYDYYRGFRESVLEGTLELARQASQVYIIGYSMNDKFAYEILDAIPQGAVITVIARSRKGASEVQQRVQRYVGEAQAVTEIFDPKEQNGISHFVENVI